MDPVAQIDEHAILGRPRKRRMELTIQHLPNSTVRRRLHRVDGSGHRRDMLVRASMCGQASRRDLDETPCLEQLEHRQAFWQRRGSCRDNEGPPPRTRFDQTKRPQASEGLADDWAAHAEGTRHVLFRGELVADLKVAGNHDAEKLALN